MPTSAALQKPLTEWDESDVQQLLDQGQDEGQRLEYKELLQLVSRTEKREAAKDVSGMANAQGGLLIYGVAEQELNDGRRVPTAITPLANGGIQAQLENILYSAVLPRLNLETRLLDVAGGYILLVRAYQRGGPPHMVVAYEDNRHYVRRGVSTSAMIQQEVEMAYAQVAASEDRLVGLIRAVPLVPPLRELTDGTYGRAGAEYPSPNDPWLSLVLAPLDHASGDLIRPSQALTSELQSEQYRYLEMSGGVAPSAEGYVSTVPRDGSIGFRMAVYRNGVIEYGETLGGRHFGESGDRGDAVASVAILNTHQGLLGLAAWMYSRQGYYGRVRSWLAIERADMTYLATQGLPPPREVRPTGRIETYADSNVEALGHAEGRAGALLPLQELLWQSYGRARCPLFTEEGQLRTNVNGLAILP